MGSAPYAEGWIDREYAVLRGRIDLCLLHRGRRFAFELKTWKPGQANPVPDGLEQLDAYLSGLGLDSGWLVVFDQRGAEPAPEVREDLLPSGRRVVVLVV